MNKKIFVLLFLIAISYTKVSSCTRVLYKGKDNIVLTARSMDWKEWLMTDLWIFPRGLERDGAVGPHSIQWTSKYGSVIAAAYNFSTADGMNEKGLVANLLWLDETKYPEWKQEKPGLSVAAWVQYVLDNYATVEEAIEDIQKEDIVILTDKLPGKDFYGTFHLSISDSNGDSGIIEYIDGKVNIYHCKEYQVLTNSPIYRDQLAINDYWKEIGGTTVLPGTNKSSDRFARGSFYINAIPQTDDIETATAGVLSVIRNCSVPFGISTPNKPNISSTRWRSVADQKNKIYYFESVMSPYLIWIDFANINFDKLKQSKVLRLSKCKKRFHGEVTKRFKKEEPFPFLGPTSI